MANLKVHYSSQSVDWATPEWLFAELDREFSFNFDPCPLYGLESGVNGLEIDWGSSTYCNPPYGRGIGLWTEKAVKEAGGGKTVVLLIPSRTDTVWWHRDVMTATEIRFIKGRLKFGGAKQGAPFPSALAIWKEGE
jgi:site-specific DNA-methyltransferase (adenine-specific)